MGKYLDKYPAALRLYRKIRKLVQPKSPYTSETSKVRTQVLPFCVGLGCDIGFGGDKIKKENCLGIDLPQPYAFTGRDKVDIPCNLFKEPIPVADHHFDYVYSSHLIEDFEDTGKALKEFIRILKSGGHLILVFPDQPKYEVHCKQTNQPLNIYHVHPTMGSTFMKEKIKDLEAYGIFAELLYEEDCLTDYNVLLVYRIQKK